MGCHGTAERLQSAPISTDGRCLTLEHARFCPRCFGVLERKWRAGLELARMGWRDVADELVGKAMNPCDRPGCCL